MRQAPAASSARNDKPRVDVSWEDLSLTPADELLGISEMAVILMSLSLAPANFKVAEVVCRNRFGDAAVSMGFERGLVKTMRPAGT